MPPSAARRSTFLVYGSSVHLSGLWLLFAVGGSALRVILSIFLVSRRLPSRQIARPTLYAAKGHQLGVNHSRAKPLPLDIERVGGSSHQDSGGPGAMH